MSKSEQRKQDEEMRTTRAKRGRDEQDVRMTRIEEEQEERLEEQATGSQSESRYEQRGLKRTGTDASMPQLREEIDPQLVASYSSHPSALLRASSSWLQ